MLCAHQYVGFAPLHFKHILQHYKLDFLLDLSLSGDVYLYTEGAVA